MVCTGSSIYAHSNGQPSKPLGSRTHASQPGSPYRLDPVWHRWISGVSSGSKNFGWNADLGRTGADAVPLRGFCDLDALDHRGGTVWLGLFQLVRIASPTTRSGSSPKASASASGPVENVSTRCCLVLTNQQLFNKSKCFQNGLRRWRNRAENVHVHLNSHSKGEVFSA